MAGENELTVSAGGRTVTIWTTKVDHNLDKPLIDIPLPRQKAAMDAEEEPETFLIDIGRVKEMVTVQGMLIDESGSAAQQKKNDLFSIVKFETSVTISWGTGEGTRKQSVTGNINKCMVTETAGIISDGDQPSGYESEKMFAVQLSLIEGTDPSL